MFNRNGHDLNYLKHICDVEKACRGHYKRIYGPAEVYSIGRYLREFAGYPQYLPMYVYCRHGSGGSPLPAPHELDNDAEAMIVWDRQTFNEYTKKSDKPCYMVTMPYVHHRRKQGITQASDAAGTLVFLSHSTPDIDMKLDVEDYIKALKLLPREFQPFSFCLHMSDIHKGLHIYFMKQGFPVYSAGTNIDIRFGDRFYNILRQFKFTLSNHIGSYAFYSVEMGIPFSHYGQEPEYSNKKDRNLPLGAYEPYATEAYKKQKNIFAGLNTAITEDQKLLCEQVLGINDGLTVQQLNRILCDAYKKRGRPFRDAVHALKSHIRSCFR